MFGKTNHICYNLSMSFEIERDFVMGKNGKKRARFRLKIDPNTDPDQLPTRIKLRLARERLGKTQTEMTRGIKAVDPNALLNSHHYPFIEQGRAPVTPALVNAFLEATGLSPDDLKGKDFNRIMRQPKKR
jgi:hypothetical protein